MNDKEKSKKIQLPGEFSLTEITAVPINKEITLNETEINILKDQIDRLIYDLSNDPNLLDKFVYVGKKEMYAFIYLECLKGILYKIENG